MRIVKKNREKKLKAAENESFLPNASCRMSDVIAEDKLDFDSMNKRFSSSPLSLVAQLVIA